jgi:hypothetical protein
MNGDQLSAFVKANMQGGKAYGTAIECRDGRRSMFRMTYQPFSGEPPFYRWQWVFGKTRDLDRIIARLRLRGEPQRKYRVVAKHSYVAANGDEMTCAILWR